MPRREFDPTLRRSWKLFQDFRVEQTDPARFYGALAADSVSLVGHHEPLTGRSVLDVGGGPGYFADAFTRAGAQYRALDSDVGEMSDVAAPLPGSVVGSGMQLPFRDGALDVVFSSNVLEHVREPWTMADEMVRVARPGGLVLISYTVWWGPWGGHETAPWHLLGGHRAAERYARRTGHRPKNDFGTSLFAVTTAAGIRWARRQTGAEVLSIFPRYLPRWAWWIVRVPGLRELATWNLVIVLRRR